MRRPLLFALLIAAPVVVAQSARTPSALDLYHSAARSYIAGETEQAIRDAERGLALDPDDAKIQRLLDLLRQQQPPQDGDGQQDDQSDQGDEGEPQENDEGGQGEPERDEAEQDQTRQNQNQDRQQGDTQNGREDEHRQQPQSGAAGQPRPASMSADEAQRLLDAVAADEELLVERMRRPTRMRRSEQDW